MLGNEDILPAKHTKLFLKMQRDFPLTAGFFLKNEVFRESVS